MHNNIKPPYINIKMIYFSQYLSTKNKNIYKYLNTITKP